MYRIWSALPRLFVTDGRHTKSISNSVHSLTESWISKWDGFEGEARTSVRALTGNLVQGLGSTYPEEVFSVGNELGVQSRFVEHIGHGLGKVFKELGINIHFAGFQFAVPHADKQGPTGRTADKKYGSRSVYPDLLIVSEGDFKILVVGELKTFWTFHKKDEETEDEFMARRLGQVVRYMDDFHCRYCFLSTYEKTLFLQRKGDMQFLRAGPTLAETASSDSKVSLAECFLFLASKLNDKVEAFYPTRVGNGMTTRKWKVSERKSKRQRQQLPEWDTDISAFQLRKRSAYD